MTGLPHSLTILFLYLFLAVGCQQVTAETTDDRLDDRTITISVKAQLATNDRHGTLTQIGVKTVERTVYLSGVALTHRDKYRAEDISARVDGVRKIMNFISVFPNTKSGL